MVLVLGDAHADDAPRREALLSAYRDADADVALQAGDLLHYDVPIPTYFIAGNNEDFDVVEALREGHTPPEASNVHLLHSTSAEVDGLRVGGLSGNYAPTRFDCDRSELAGGRRRHFVRDDVERAKDLDVDVFLAHEAPHGLPVAEEYGVGCKHVDDVLQSVRPDLCLVGHHHEHAETTFGDTRVVSLAPAWEAYYALDPETLDLTRHETPGDGQR
ncbi:MAG: metallophosphoesterase [Halobacteriaceae archaeon]